MIVGFTALMMIVGLLMYVLTNRPESGKVAEIGRIMFACGLLALLLAGDQVLRLTR